MDSDGNILIKRVSKSNVYVKCTNDGGEKGENSIGNEILKLSNCALEVDKPMKVSYKRICVYPNTDLWLYLSNS